ncbi:GGDEF domain-containing protein [Paraglaciecola aquimarina]|uniref:diguanylate cyclase n=1 Tax=Paraglaciecola aquimarina TaxID=1235557 RepID=A0ABU3SVC2_9ALTE|nr:GGDEF domain-containing protein [Paraglaciecola aquimarina]MDU0353969.1 GGDEF domain-containing protein [Paraglaciecola aquimarina]
MAVDKSLAEMHWKHDLLGSIEVGIVVLDKEFNVHVWNQFMENHSSIVPSMIQGQNVFEFFPEIDKGWFTRKAAPVFSLKSPVFVIWEQRPYLFRFGCNRPITSKAEHMYQNITIFPLASLTGEVEQICVVIYDVTDEAVSRMGMQSLNIQLQEISRVDGLTGLYNRRYWNEQFDLHFKRAKRSDSDSALIILDIDHFKKVNDTYGHPAGDQVIQALAQIIKKTIRETDIAGRYGGEEFAIILPDTPVANVEFVSERLRRLVEKCVVDYGGVNISFTISIGIAGFDSTHETSAQWLESADKVLYQAKAAGRNRVILAE